MSNDIDNKLIQEAQKLISDLTKKGKFWRQSEVLDLQKRLINKGVYVNKKTIITPEMISAASSTYYAASGNAVSRAQQSSNPFSKLFWYWRAWRCLRKAKKCSDKFASLKKMEDMTLGELDVRACVLHKSGHIQEALLYLGHGIMKISTKQTGTKHDLCLFLIHEAGILAQIGKTEDARKDYGQALTLAKVRVVPALTKVRVLVSYGRFLSENKETDSAEWVLGEALELAKEESLYDQERKIKAVFKKFKLVIR